jgi:hypothetical protein
LPIWFNAVANKKDCLARLQLTIQHWHDCRAICRETVPVPEVFRGQTVWRGAVEVVDLAGHPKAKRCYGWTPGGPEKFIAIGELPPVDSAPGAVKVGVAYQIEKARP